MPLARILKPWLARVAPQTQRPAAVNASAYTRRLASLASSVPTSADELRKPLRLRYQSQTSASASASDKAPTKRRRQSDKVPVEFRCYAQAAKRQPAGNQYAESSEILGPNTTGIAWTHLACERWRPTVQVYRCSGGSRIGRSCDAQTRDVQVLAASSMCASSPALRARRPIRLTVEAAGLRRQARLTCDLEKPHHVRV